MMICVLKFLGSLAFVARLNAQTTDVTSCVPEYQWAINSLNQTPCLVAAVLESACSGRPHQVNRIPAGTHYIGPTASDADLCSCNTVTYSLVEACGGCQSSGQLINFTQWTNNCPTIVPVGQFPMAFPSGVEVPSWAELDISQTNNVFDPVAAAREAARSNASFPTSSVILSSSTRTPIQIPPSQSSAPLPASSGTATGGVSAGGIAGITVGVLLVVVAILLFIFWRMLRARRQRNSMQAPKLRDPMNPFNEKQNIPSIPTGHVHSRSLSDPTSIVTPYIYSPADVNLQSDSAGASAFFTTGPARTSVDDLVSPQTAMSPKTIMTVQRSNTPQNIGSRGYTGAPEV